MFHLCTPFQDYVAHWRQCWGNYVERIDQRSTCALTIAVQAVGLDRCQQNTATAQNIPSHPDFFGATLRRARTFFRLRESKSARGIRVKRCALRAKGGRIVSVGTTSLRLLEGAAADDGAIQPFTGETSIFITPGYRFRAVDILLTNFHLPRSTLFMLVSAFAGLETMKHAYAHAIAGGYRFYSYGDATLLFRR